MKIEKIAIGILVAVILISIIMYGFAVTRIIQSNTSPTVTTKVNTPIPITQTK
jgi:hypothetical protein